jgi:hypothetical protein
MALHIFHQEDALVVASFGGVYFSIWWYLPTAAQVLLAHEQQKRFRQMHQGDYALLSLMKVQKVRSLSGDARNAAAETRKFLGPCVAEANVIEAGGIGISIAQMLFAALNLINRSKHPVNLYTKLPEAVAWLAPFVKVDPIDLINAIEEAVAARPQISV